MHADKRTRGADYGTSRRAHRPSMFSTTCWDQHAQQEFRYEVWIARDPAPRGLEDPDAVWRLDDKAALGGLVAEYET